MTAIGGTALAYGILQALYELWVEPHRQIVTVVIAVTSFNLTCVPLWLIAYAFVTRKYEVAVEMGSTVFAIITFFFWVMVEQHYHFMERLQKLDRTHRPVRGDISRQILYAVQIRMPALINLAVPFAMAATIYYFARRMGYRALFSPALSSQQNVA